MKVLSLIFASCAISAVASAATVVVDPSNMDGWSFYKTDPSAVYGAGDATGQMVSGPATPPLGTGSANFNTGSDGFQSAQLRTGDWAGTRIDALTSLSYSTYASAWNGQQLPYLTIYIDWDNNGSQDDRLWFEPDYTSPALLNVWQTWDALSGQWYSDVEFGPGSNTDNLTAYLALHPNATIINDAGNGIGGIRIASGFAGSGDHFDTNVDNFTIGTAAGTTTYDFEAVPEPTVPGLLMIGTIGLLVVRYRRAKARTALPAS